MKKTKLTPEQKRALANYQFAERQEDRYMESKVRAAYEACKRLGMTYEHGL